MTKPQRIFPLLFFAGLLSAQQQTPVAVPQPDCVKFFTLGNTGSLTLNSANQDNRQVGCYSWTVAYTSSGFSALSVTFQDAPDSSGTPGTFVTFGGATVIGSNPSTAITSAIATFTGYFPWLRVHLSGTTGSGAITGVFYGWRAQGARIGGGGGGGGGDVVGPASATDKCFARFDGTTGKLIQDSVVCATDAGNVTTPGTLAVGVGGVASGTIDMLQITSGNAISFFPADDNGDPSFIAVPGGKSAFMALNAVAVNVDGNCAQYNSEGNLADSGAPCGGGGGTPGSPTNSFQVNNAGAFAGAPTMLYTGTLGNEGIEFFNSGGVTNVFSKAGAAQSTNPFNTILRNDDSVAYGIVLGGSAVTAFPNFRIDSIGDFIFNTPADLFLGFDRDAMQIFLGQTNLLMTGGSGTRLTWTSSDVTGTKDTGIARNAAGVLEINNGTAGTFRDLRSRTDQVSVVAVASLGTCNAGAEGKISAVNDALAPSFLVTIVGGGAIHAPVYCNGTNWVAF